MGSTMRKTGVADLPLHYGRAPAWLFSRMKQLAGEIIRVMVSEFGAEELLRKISDPLWFQALGCLLGFDWHSSGVTTTVCGALKEAVKGQEKELGFFVAGGKGAVSRRTPQEILSSAEHLSVNPSPLIYASRMAAKVDTAAVQDGFQLYHHCFFFTPQGNWAVVQQGMNEILGYARRYHWIGEKVENFVDEPHSAICCDLRVKGLNMVARESEKTRSISTLLAKEKPPLLIREIEGIRELKLPFAHSFSINQVRPKNLEKRLWLIYERSPQSFEELIGIPGVGAKTVRALVLLADLLYHTRPSFRDPATYSFAHGGKDGYPYPVEREVYDQTISFLNRAVSQAKIGRTEKLKALRRLTAFASEKMRG